LQDGNILSAAQYVSGSGRFFMRSGIAGERFSPERDEFEVASIPLIRKHAIGWRVSCTDMPKRNAILVQKYAHCLTDPLWR
jgi:formyltetrahydrofolate deformylase